MGKIFNLIEKTYAPLTVNAALSTETLDVSGAETIAFAVVASSASSPTGTTITVNGSLDGTNFFAVGSPVTVTGNGTFAVTASGLTYRYYRLAYARSGGSYVATTSVLVKGN